MSDSDGISPKTEQSNSKEANGESTKKIHPDVVVPPKEVQESAILDKGEDLENPEWMGKVRHLILGKPLDIADKKVFHHLTLAALFAWVGLGADGLSSSCYGPSEAFHHLGSHAYLAIFLAFATVGTVFIISLCYSHIIEEFSSGGGGYLVASKILGKNVGVISGSALLVDYILTITVSIAAAGDAIFGLLPPQFSGWKLLAEIAAILSLILLNLRGIKESIMALLPIFMLFLLTHALIIFGVLGMHIGDLGPSITRISEGVKSGLADPSLGLFGMMTLLLHAYSLGAGTYTGIEAVSNSMPVMREPKVATAKRTMIYMALSLAITAGGLMVGYLLLNIERVSDRTMNQVLTERFVSDLGLSPNVQFVFVMVTMFAEGMLLYVAAQAGFIDGPRVLANMARDSYVPHWFANLSDRLANHNGIMLMGLAALSALVYTGGEVSTLVIMYSINVFLTFSLSMVAMCKYWWEKRETHPIWIRRFAVFFIGAVLCISILSVTIIEKFSEGGWKTLLVTGLCVVGCLLINREYKSVVARLNKLNENFGDFAGKAKPIRTRCDPKQPTAAILVGGYNGLGKHTLLGALRFLPDYFKNVAFISVCVLDSGNFKGSEAVEELKTDTEDCLKKYELLARQMGLPATSYMVLGTDPAEELEGLCAEVAKEFPKVVFFAGQLVFQKDQWYHRLLHNETAFSVQRRLQWRGLSVVILPTRVR